jgi:hypothetical protein
MAEWPEAEHGEQLSVARSGLSATYSDVQSQLADVTSKLQALATSPAATPTTDLSYLHTGPKLKRARTVIARPSALAGTPSSPDRKDAACDGAAARSDPAACRSSAAQLCRRVCTGPTSANVLDTNTQSAVTTKSPVSSSPAPSVLLDRLAAAPFRAGMLLLLSNADAWTGTIVECPALCAS